MMPSRETLSSWDPGSMLRADVEGRGRRVEAAGDGLRQRVGTMPETKEWSGAGHDAALDAYDRIRRAGRSIGAAADELAKALTGAHHTMAGARHALLDAAAGIEKEPSPFFVDDKWVVLIKEGPLTQDEIDDLRTDQQSNQDGLNHFAKAVAAADDPDLLAAALGPELGPYLRTVTTPGPESEAPDPRFAWGEAAQRLLRDEYEATTPADSYSYVASGGIERTDVRYQNGNLAEISRSTVESPPELAGSGPATLIVTRTWNRDNHESTPTSTVTTVTRGDEMSMTAKLGDDVEIETYYNNDVTQCRGTVTAAGEKKALDQKTLDRLRKGAEQASMGLDVALSVGEVPLPVPHKLGAPPEPTLSTKWATVGKAGGIALSLGTAIYDYAQADTDYARCVSAVGSSSSILGGMAAGAATGAAIGSAGTPIGTAVGIALGSIIGGMVAGEVGKGVAADLCPGQDEVRMAELDRLLSSG